MHDRERRHDRNRHHGTRDQRRPKVAQEKENNSGHQHHRQRQMQLDLRDRCPDRPHPVAQNLDFHRRWNRRLQFAHQIADSLDCLDHVRVGLLSDDHADAPLIVHPRRGFRVFRSFDRPPDVAHPDRRAISISEDHIVVGFRIQKLIVCINRQTLVLPTQTPFRRIDRRGRDHATHVVQTETERGEFSGVDLHPDCRFLFTHDADLRHPAELGNLLGDHIRCIITHFGERQHVRQNAQQHDR